MQTIGLVHQYTYGQTTCIYCGKITFWHAQSRRTGKPCHATLHNTRRWALEAGWKRNKRKQMVCPDCAKAKGL